ncbi:MAG: LysM peptidoglycan-binding domain-containing protein [Lentisphaeria bacterium]|nr:LysM peptidoglycan-binding domain-containing protein [Lentisphaeria bacterium]
MKIKKGFVMIPKFVCVISCSAFALLLSSCCFFEGEVKKDPAAEPFRVEKQAVDTADKGNNDQIKDPVAGDPKTEIKFEEEKQPAEKVQSQEADKTVTAPEPEQKKVAEPEKKPEQKKVVETKYTFPCDHTVKTNDSLWIMAKKYYGKGSQWKVIYNANKTKIKNANRLEPGMVLTIPALSEKK